LDIDVDAVIADVVAGLDEAVHRTLRKRGAVVAVSGGIDSSVVLGLCARAFGPDHVLGLLMPERESSPETEGLSRAAVEAFGVGSVLEDVTGILESVACYRRRDDAFRELIPAYGPGWRGKIVLPAIVGGDSYRIFSLVARSPAGDDMRVRVTADAARRIVAATNFKQRVRKMLEYFHADRLEYAVVGTPNRLEHELAFFVKNGDGSADVKPIAGLYKTQVYALAAALGVPGEIRSRVPTTDTYPLEQDQDEFFFSLPYERMDLALYARNNGYPAEALATALDVTVEDASRIYRDIDSKRRLADLLHAPAVTA
jgi:NAD+ synthase